jgi:hypothetical protein
MSTLPDVRVGDPIRHESLAIFPLFSPTDGQIDYLLSDEAIGAGKVTVEEVNEGGSVPNLLVTNQGDTRVLFLEGEELRGAKQNRVLNTSVLVAAHSKTPIPVSCVEQGRWHYRTRHFVSGGSHSSSKLRHILKKSAYRSMKAGHGYSSDQMQVWGEVTRQMDSLGSSSETMAMSATYETYRGRLAEFRESLKYVEGATGVAVAVGTKVVAMDLFDKPSTCAKVWDRLLSGVVLDALERTPTDQVAQRADVEGLLGRLRKVWDQLWGGVVMDAPEERWTDQVAQRADVEGLLTRLREGAWEPAPAVGEGQEYRYDADADTHASALVCGGSVLHGSVAVAN